MPGFAGDSAIDWSHLLEYLPAALVVLLSVVVSGLVGRSVRRIATPRMAPQQVMVVSRLARYGFLLAGIAVALGMAGVHLGVVLGAAGVLSVALGFAAQTSTSNIISGLFLITERPFVIGDTIQVGSRTGEVLEIGWLSVTLRTFDNLAVRLPNESLIKSEIVNLSRFPLRRLDLKVQVAYRHAPAEVEAVLREVARRNPLCLDEPAPTFIVLGFGESGIDVQFSPWAERSQYLAMRNSVQTEILAALRAHDIEIPYPHRVVLQPAPAVPDASQAEPETP